MVLIAIFVSRFDAIFAASMLRGYGIHTSIDGEAHASAEYISLALGGHRLRVFAEDYEVASDLLRDAGVLEDRETEKGPSSALLKFVSLVMAMNASTLLPAVFFGTASIAWLLYIPLSVFTIPIDPRGRPDYFLAAPLNESA